MNSLLQDIRVALGTRRRDVLRLVLKRCLTFSAVGITIGLVLFAPVGLAIQSQRFGVSALLLVVAALAGYVPARRATRIDPMVALRCE